MKIHLVDGTYELFRNHFGAPPRKSPDGREVGATLGLLRSLLALLARPDTTHIACAFDHVIKSFRNDLFPGYKTGEGVDPILTAQFQLAEEAVSALGVVAWSMVEFEADDAPAAAGARYKNKSTVEQIVICSPDKDLMQLVSGTRIVCGTVGGILYSMKKVSYRSLACVRIPSLIGLPWLVIPLTGIPAYQVGGPNPLLPCFRVLTTWSRSRTNRRNGELVSAPHAWRRACPRDGNR